MDFKVNLRKNYNRTEPGNDYLKYYKVVKYWARHKYEISSQDFDMICYLYSEKLFTRPQFQEFECIFSWDNHRFNRMTEAGWIIKWRPRIGMEKALYELSRKGKSMMVSVYKKLNGEEPISETRQNNTLFNKNVSYTDNMYKRTIKNMNRNNAEKRRLKRIEEDIYQQQPYVIKYRQSRGLPPHQPLE